MYIEVAFEIVIVQVSSNPAQEILRAVRMILIGLGGDYWTNQEWQEEEKKNTRAKIATAEIPLCPFAFVDRLP